jgi:hypothetical protein
MKRVAAEMFGLLVSLAAAVFLLGLIACAVRHDVAGTVTFGLLLVIESVVVLADSRIVELVVSRERR